MSIKANQSVYRLTYLSLFLVGVSVLLYQYMYNRSLWVDEAYLANNILERSWVELLQPLNYNQVAPILFLYAAKLNAILFGPGEMSLRLFPLCCGILCLPLYYSFSLKITKSKAASLGALFFIVFNSSFIYYSTEFKQYIVDGAIALLLFNVYLSQDISLQKKTCLFLVVSLLSIYFSNISVIYLATIGIHIFYKKISVSKSEGAVTSCCEIDRLKWSTLFCIFLIVLVNFSIYYCFFIYGHPTKLYMQEYWSRHGGFVPLSVSGAGSWLYKLLYLYLSSLLHHKTIIILCAVLFFYSFVVVLRSSKELFILLFVPLFLHIILAVLRIYPLQGRLFFHYVFFGSVVIAYGANSIYTKITSLFLKRCFIFSLCIYAVVYAQKTEERLPLYNQEMKPAIRYVEKNITANDNLFIFFAAYPVFSYYKSIDFTALGENNKMYFMDNKLGMEGRLRDETFDQVKTLENKRTWFLFAQYVFSDVKSVYRILSKRGKFSIQYSMPGVLVCCFEPSPSGRITSNQL